MCVSDDWFEDLTAGDLRLAYAVEELVDQGEDLGDDLLYDLDKRMRGDNGPPDLGVSEYIITSDTKEEAAADFGLSVYPNPSTDYIILETATDSKYDISIRSSDQKLIYSSSQEELLNGFYLSTQNWDAGMYIGRITGGSGTSQVFRIVVQE